MSLNVGTLSSLTCHCLSGTGIETILLVRNVSDYHEPIRGVRAGPVSGQSISGRLRGLYVLHYFQGAVPEICSSSALMNLPIIVEKCLV